MWATWHLHQLLILVVIGMLALARGGTLRSTSLWGHRTPALPSRLSSYTEPGLQRRAALRRLEWSGGPAGAGTREEEEVWGGRPTFQRRGSLVKEPSIWGTLEDRPCRGLV